MIEILISKLFLFLYCLLMFIRTKKSTSGSISIQIVENKRVWDKTKQTVLKHVWSNKNQYEVEGIKRTAKYIMQELICKWTTWLFPSEMLDAEMQKQIEQPENKDSLKVDLKDIHEEQRVIKWIQDIYWKLYTELWFDKILWQSSRNSEYSKCLKQITLARIASPKSKRASVEMLDRDYWININLDTVYKIWW